MERSLKENKRFVNSYKKFIKNSYWKINQIKKIKNQKINLQKFFR